MAEIAELGLKITSEDVVTAIKRLDKLEAQGKKNEKQFNKTSGAFDLFKRALPIVAIGATTKAILGVADSFQNLNAKLLTATGSQEAAALALSTLKDLAFEMPGSIEEVTNSFIKLSNLGLNPSREALISYGNTAAAMGKSLDQLIEAVADAATGEFERLKEFGIKSRNEGDQIAFTFQGITTRVENSSDAIQKYLQALGQNQFAGAMEKQNKTLGSAFTDLSDSVALATEKLASESGFTSAVISATQQVGKLIRQISGTETESDLSSTIDGINEQIEYFNQRIIEAQNLRESDRGFFAEFFGASPEAIIRDAQAQLNRLNEQRKQIEEELSAKQKERQEQEKATTGVEKDKDLSKDLEKLREATKTELEIVQEKYDQRQSLLDEALLTEQISEEEHQDQLNRIQKEYADKRIKLKEAEKMALLSIQTGILDNLSSLMASGSKKQFEIGKIAAIASALLKGREAVIGAYSAGSKVGGPILGGIFAASAAVAVGTQINAIKNTQFGGGGTVSAPGGGSPGTAPVPTPPALEEPQRAAGTTVNINLGDEDGVVPKSTIRKMIEGINEELRNGAVIEGITVG